MRRAAWLLLLLYAFAVPWEYSLDLGPPFGNIARILGLAVLAASMFAIAQSRLARPPGPLQWIVLVLFLWLCCSYFWSIDPEATLIRLRGYFQEMVIVWLLWEFTAPDTDLRWFLRAIVAGSWLLALLTLIGGAPLQSAGEIRFVAEGQDPNVVAHYLDLALPLAALLACEEGKWLARAFSLAYLPVGLFAVLLTASRGGFMAALVALAGCGIILSRHPSRFVRRGWMAIPLLLGGLAFLVPHATLQRLGTIREQLVRGDLNQRVNIWDAGWRAFCHAPFLGTGAGTFVSAAGTATVDTAHNTALSIAVEGGIVGLILASIIVACSAVAVAQMRGLARIAFGTVLLVWLVTSLVATVEQTRITWLLLAAISVAGRIDSPHRASIRSRLTVSLRESA
jgi:O-antigen ligase